MSQPLMWLFLSLIFSFQSQVLVLKDGRTIGIQGEYEIHGSEVQFTSSTGDLLLLPLSKINLKATEKHNNELKQKMDRQIDAVTPKRGEPRTYRGPRVDIMEPVKRVDTEESSQPSANLLDLSFSGILELHQSYFKEGGLYKKISMGLLGLMLLTGLPWIFIHLTLIFFRAVSEEPLWAIVLSITLLSSLGMMMYNYYLPIEPLTDARYWFSFHLVLSSIFILGHKFLEFRWKLAWIAPIIMTMLFLLNLMMFFILRKHLG